MENKKHNYMVLMDFSESSFIALKYAVSMAKSLGGKIQIFHIADIKKIVKSGDKVIDLREIQLETERIEAKLKSIIEIILTEGIQASYQHSMGSIANKLEEYIDLVKPCMIIIGRKKDKSLFSGKFTRYLLNEFLIPLLVVCKEVEFQSNTKISLGYNSTTFFKYNPQILFKLDSLTESPLSLVNVKVDNGPKTELELPKKWQPYFEKSNNNHFQYEKKNTIGESLKQYVIEEKIELLCIGRGDYKGTLFNRVFNQNPTLVDIINQVNIPIMILRG